MSEDPYAFMTERLTYDAGEAFAPSRYCLVSKADVIVGPYKTYDLFFEIEFHVKQKLGAYEDIGTPEECRKAMEFYKARKPDRKPDHGYMWICPKCGIEVHSDFERCVCCGNER